MMLKREEEMGEKRMAVKCKMGLLMGTVNGNRKRNTEIYCLL